MGHSIFFINLRKLLVILIVKEGLVCLVHDGNLKFGETYTRAK